MWKSCARAIAMLTGICGAAWTARAAEPPVKADGVDARIARLKQAGFPLIDFHVHLKGGLTIEEAVALSRRNGIRYGIAANCGLKFSITDDRGIEEFIKSLKGQPVFVGMQAEGREWPRLFSKEAVAKFDYVFTDAMTIIDHRGQRARLWMKEEVDIPDKQAFMELLVRTIVNILNDEPIDIYVNPPIPVLARYSRRLDKRGSRRLLRRPVHREVAAGRRIPELR
jgi:hypothetical protein